MHTVELLEQALGLAARLGYQIRQEWMGECGGGACEFGGRKWLFVDVSRPAAEQLGQVVDSLRQDPRLADTRVSPQLRGLLNAERVV